MDNLTSYSASTSKLSLLRNYVWTCMWVCVCECVNMCVNVWEHVCLSVCVNMCVRVCEHVCEHVLCECVNMCVCVCVWTCVWACVCVYTSPFLCHGSEDNFQELVFSFHHAGIRDETRVIKALAARASTHWAVSPALVNSIFIQTKCGLPRSCPNKQVHRWDVFSLGAWDKDAQCQQHVSSTTVRLMRFLPGQCPPQERRHTGLPITFPSLSAPPALSQSHCLNLFMTSAALFRDSLLKRSVYPCVCVCAHTRVCAQRRKSSCAVAMMSEQSLTPLYKAFLLPMQQLVDY